MTDIEDNSRDDEEDFSPSGSSSTSSRAFSPAPTTSGQQQFVQEIDYNEIETEEVALAWLLLSLLLLLILLCFFTYRDFVDNFF